MIKRQKFLILALTTLVGFGLGGWLIIKYLQDASLQTLLMGKTGVGYQALIGAVYGLGTALLGWRIVELPFFKPTMRFFVDLIKSLELSFVEIIFLSFCAGVGEEIFFRGAIQPYLGIWITSVLFVAMHGYLNPFNLKISLYGLFMTLIIVGLGYMTVNLGLLSAIVAHTCIDIVLLYKLSNSQQDTEEENTIG